MKVVPIHPSIALGIITEKLDCQEAWIERLFALALDGDVKADRALTIVEELQFLVRDIRKQVKFAEEGILRLQLQASKMLLEKQNVT